ncbi:MAG: biopolymer transporter ExbD [Lewinellaceae bacterium]|nr:biopolymer transporter ExbD [Saprospiraceae bacterium]MCB9339163.1 biopolymer transporter ExbD [Lewinellaceae bacterium]
MGLKKKNKISTAFSTASMTDMIFLLLIFFMLTSGLVAPNALNLKLPGTSKSKIQIDSKTDDVSINKSGSFYLNGKRVSAGDLEAALAKKARGGDLDITISPEAGTAVKYVAFVMDIAMRYQINAILTSEEK